MGVRRVVFWGILTLGLTGVAYCEWHANEDEIIVATIVAASFLCGTLRPSLFWIAGLLLGLSVSAVDLTIRVIGQLSPYAAHIPSWFRTLGAAALVILAIISSVYGARLGRVLQPQYHRHHYRGSLFF